MDLGDLGKMGAEAAGAAAGSATYRSSSPTEDVSCWVASASHARLATTSSSFPLSLLRPVSLRKVLLLPPLRPPLCKARRAWLLVLGMACVPGQMHGCRPLRSPLLALACVKVQACKQCTFEWPRQSLLRSCKSCAFRALVQHWAAVSFSTPAGAWQLR